MDAWTMNIGQSFIMIGEVVWMDIKLETGKFIKK